MDVLALLRQQIEWGADEALEDAPVDRLRPAPSPKSSPGVATSRVPRTEPPATPGSPPAPPAAAGSAAQRAVAAAGQAQNIEELRAALAAFDGCSLRDTAANLVFAAGDPHATLMLIGDAPGEAEDRSGIPFAGPDGALLDRMLASIGVSRETLLCTPLIPWRPPGGRVPNPGEIAVCLPFLHRLLALASPRRVLIASQLAARTLLGGTRRRTTPAWNEMTVPGAATAVPALVMPGPKLVAQNPSARREAWAALRLLRRTLDADLADK